MKVNDAGKLVKRLAWDSQFFGVEIGRVLVSRLTALDVARINAFADAARFDCLYLLAAADDLATARLAAGDGYRQVDLRVTLAARLGALPAPDAAPPNLRPAVEGDIPALRQIARTSHSDTRFYHDGRFDRARCDELYAVWIEKSVRGGADRALAWEEDGRAAAYATGKLEAGGGGSIELVGVHPEWRGKGIGRRLIQHLLAWFAEQGVKRVTVVTQGRNAGAQALYQRCGFSICSTEAWFHKWFVRG